MKRLISDGGEMTVGRRTASWVWGRFDVTLADGDTTAAVDDRIVDGFVYRPDDRQRGLFDLTFVRADARLDMNAEQSDLEATLDGASRRTEGGAFHTKTISGDGLARTRPGVDYRRGDMVEVLVWGKTMELPVTGITATSSLDNPLGWEVQVGGQLVRDAEALRKRNSDLAAQIAAEKRQRMKETGEIRTAVDEEQDSRMTELDKIVERLGRLQEELMAEGGHFFRFTSEAPIPFGFINPEDPHLSVAARLPGYDDRFPITIAGTYDVNLTAHVRVTGGVGTAYVHTQHESYGEPDPRWLEGVYVSATDGPAGKKITMSDRIELRTGGWGFGVALIRSSGAPLALEAFDVTLTLSRVPGA